MVRIERPADELPDTGQAPLERVPVNIKLLGRPLLVVRSVIKDSEGPAERRPIALALQRRDVRLDQRHGVVLVV